MLLWLLFLSIQITTLTADQTQNGVYKLSGVDHEVLSKDEIDSVKEKYNLLKDRDLDVQKIYKNTVTYDGKTYKLEGDPIDDIFATDATFNRNGKVGKRPSISTIKKVYEDEIVSIVKKPDGEIESVIIHNTKNGRTVELVNVLPNSNTLVTITADNMDQEKINKIFRYADHDALGFPWIEQSTSDATTNRAKTVANSCDSYRKIELAVAYESSFCAVFGSETDAENAVTTVVELVSQKYQQVGLCVKVVISYMEGYCESATDPYKEYVDINESGCGNTGLLQGFRDYWNDNMGSVHRDTAHLFSGTGLECSNDGSCVVGCANMFATCSLGSAYGVNYVTFSSDWNLRAVLVAHELGHNNGANHVQSDQYIMYALVKPAALGFSQTSIDAFESLFSRTTCVGPAAPPGPTPTPSAKPSILPGICGNGMCEADVGEQCFSCAEDCSTSNVCKEIGVSPFTTLSYGSQVYGNMFDVEVQNDVTIYGLDVLLLGESDLSLTVYTKESTYEGSETTSGDWAKVFDGIITPGDSIFQNFYAAYAPVIFDSVVSVSSSSVLGIYVLASDSQRVLYIDTSASGEIMASNEDLKIIVGKNSFTPSFSLFFSNGGYAGLVRYMNGITTRSPSPSSNPSVYPSYSPSVSFLPSARPSNSPSSSLVPSVTPTSHPSFSSSPSSNPSEYLSSSPSVSFLPSGILSNSPSSSLVPSVTPTSHPSFSSSPSSNPSELPSYSPTVSFLPSDVAPSLSTLPSETPTVESVSLLDTFVQFLTSILDFFISLISF